ncbi:MAG: hypothetical protein JXQ83_10085 [Candidatus Glassbacteria bacterium]|nr:hypothetical protein [Candidatus Glassbacteria bacterium]
MNAASRKSYAVVSVALLCCGAACQDSQEGTALKARPRFDSQALHAQAVEESLVPVRPGVPGKSPFWNVGSTRFIYAPAFDFQPVQGAAAYCFTAVPEPEGREYVFQAAEPWALLTPAWKDLPVGYVSLEVEALDSSGNSLGSAGTRRFYRAAPFDGPYGEPVRDYRECARLGLKFLFGHDILRNWLTHGRPDPRYSLYCYPSKMIAAVIGGMLLYAEIAPEDKHEALQIAGNAAEYLIGVSEPAGAPLEFFPPTYDSTHIDTAVLYQNDIDWEWARMTAGKFHGQVMLIYPASVANAYLDLFDATGDSSLLRAAERIADTYARVQLPDGNWHLKIYTSTGAPVVDNHARLAQIVPLLERLQDNYHIDKYGRTLALARPLLEARAADFNFEGQFEDIEPSRAYLNLAHGTAVEIARKLLEEADRDPGNTARAEELLRFAEDQFVIWERPIPVPRTGEDGRSEDWITPCALEQYECYCPVDASAAGFISIFRQAYQATGKELYLAKAVSLANTMTRVQDPQTGYLPTWWEKNTLDKFGWINCGIYDARVMWEFGTFMDGLEAK